MRVRTTVLWLLASAALAACSQPSLPPASQSGAVSGAAVHSRHASTATLTITLPQVLVYGAPVDWQKNPRLLAPETGAVAGTIGGQAFGPVAISATGTGCTFQRAYWQCNVTVDAPVGQNLQLVYHTYPSTSSSSVLAYSNSRVNVYAGRNVTPPTQAYSIARSLAIVPSPTSVSQGFSTTVSLLVYGIDAAGQPIPASEVYSIPQHSLLTYALQFTGNVNGYQGEFRCCGYPKAGSVTYFYTGVGSKTETITATPKGLPTATAKIGVSPGFQGAAELLAYSGANQSEFALAANGNAAPLRDLFLPAAGNPLVKEALGGEFWIGTTRYTNRGNVINTATIGSSTLSAIDSHGNLYGSIRNPRPCTVDEYPAPWGGSTPIRSIKLIAGCNGAPLPFPMTVDESGNIFVSVMNRILKYSPTSGSGYVTPSQTMTLPVYCCAQLDSDASGNLYALAAGANGVKVYKFAPGASTGVLLLSSGNLPRIVSIAVSEHGTLYADYASPSKIAVYPPGSTTPSQVITGSSTGLSSAVLAVPRSI